MRSLPGIGRLLLSGIALFAPAGMAAAGEPERDAAAPAVQFPILDGTGIDDLARSYRDLYLAFAGVDRAAAIARTVAFERAALAAEPKKGYDRLSDADSRLVAHLAEIEPAALPALTLFYQELSHRYAVDHDYGLLLRSNRATTELLRRMALASTDEPARRLTACGYQGFAADLLEIHAPARAEEMLELGLAMTPDDVPANLALAILLQREERYAAAVLRLDRALAVEPANRELRLRRALLRLRVDPDGKAIPELESLAAGAEGDWITVLATQERGRALMARGKWERAVAWFASAAERFPKEHGFRVALAYCQSRAGQRNGAAATAEKLLSAPRGASPSARLRFADSPVRLLEAGRQEMQQAAETRFEPLRIALAGLPGNGTPGPAEAAR